MWTLYIDINTVIAKLLDCRVGQISSAKVLLYRINAKTESVLRLEAAVKLHMHLVERIRFAPSSPSSFVSTTLLSKPVIIPRSCLGFLD